MIVEKLKLKNFQNYEFQEIEFEEGVSLFYGANGSGKSTILRGIFAGLFQTSMTTESAVNYTIGDLIKSDKNEGSVTITFVANNNRYVVDWELEKYQGSSKTKSCTLQTPSGTYSGVRSVAEKVESIIGMDAQSFVNSVYVQQLDMMELISSSPSTRKKIFDGLLGFRQIDEYIERAELAKREVKSLQKDKKTVRDDIQTQQLENLPSIDRLTSQISSVENKISKKKQQKDKLQEKSETLQEQLDEINEAKEELEEIQQELSTVTENIEELQGEKATLREKKNELLDTKEETADRVSHLKDVAEEHLDTCDFSLPDEVAEIEATDITERIETLNKTINTKQGNKSRLNTELSQAETRESQKKQQKKEYTEQLNEIELQLDSIDDGIASAKSQKEELNARFEELTDALADTIGELLEIISEVETAEVTINSGEIQRLTPEKIQDLSDVDIERVSEATTSSINRKISDLNEKQDRLSSRISEKSDELSEIETELNDIKTTETLELDATFWNPHIDSPESVQTDRTPTEIRKDISEQLDSGANVEDLTDEATALYNALLQQNNERYNSLVSEKETLEKTIKQLKSKKQAVSDDIDLLTTAQSTGNILTEHAQELHQLYKSFEETNSLIDSKEETKSELESEEETIEQKRESIDEEIADAVETQSELTTELQKVNDYLNSLNSNTEQLKELREIISELGSAKEDHSEIQEKIDSKETRINEIQNELESLEEQKSDLQTQEKDVESQLNQDPERLEKKLTKLDEKEDQVEEKLGNLQQKQTKLTVKKDNRENYEQRVSELDSAISRLADRQSELDSVISVYSNVKTEYRKQAITYINEYTNQIFQKLYTNKQYTRIEIDEEYNVSLHKQSGGAIDPQFSSGGEGAIVNIAIRAGIYRVISEQSGQSRLPPFILDEPTTFLDSEHIGKLERFIQALRDWDVTQVFLVSHEELLIDSADILYEISLDEDNNSSISKTHQ